MSVLNVVLFLNTLLANLANILCSFTTILVILTGKSEVTGLKAAVLALSFVNFFEASLSSLQFPIYVMPPNKATQLLGVFFPNWLSENLARFDDIMIRESMVTLAVTFIYRTLLATNPFGRVKTCTAIIGSIGIILPIIQGIFMKSYVIKYMETCDYWCVNNLSANETNSGIWKYVVDSEEDNWSSIYDLVLFLVVMIVGLRCRRLLNRIIKIGDFSERTKCVQRCLSKGMLIMLLIHIANFYPAIIAFLIGLIKGFFGTNVDYGQDDTLIFITSLSQIIIECWQIPAISFVTLLSVRPLIRIRRKTLTRETTVTIIIARPSK